MTPPVRRSKSLLALEAQSNFGWDSGATKNGMPLQGAQPSCMQTGGVALLCPRLRWPRPLA